MASGVALGGQLHLRAHLREHGARGVQVGKYGVGNGYEWSGHDYRFMASSMCSISVNTTGPILRDQHVLFEPGGLLAARDARRRFRWRSTCSL